MNTKNSRQQGLWTVGVKGLFVMGAMAPAVWAQQRAIFDFDVATGQPVDISGSGVQASVLGATHTTAGYEGGAFEFDGVDDWIRVGLDASPLTHAFPQFSMGAFVRVDSVAPVVQSILSADNGNFDRTIAIDSRSTGTPSWSAFAGGCAGSFAGPIATPSSSWHFVATVYDRFAVHDLASGQWGTVRLYVDGVETQSWACPWASTDFIAIGKNPGFGESFHGAIDNVFFFSGILSKDQLDQIRLGGKAVLLAVQPDNSERKRFLHDGFDPEPASEDVVLPAGNMPQPPHAWAYRMSYPGHAWAQPGYNDAAWPRGHGGFGYPGDPWEQDVSRTMWGTRDLFVRTTFELTVGDLQNVDGYPVALWGRWDDRIEVFINGQPAMLLDPEPPDELRENGIRPIDGRFGQPPYAEGLVTPWRYRYMPITKEANDALVVGENTLAIHAVNDVGAGYLDMGVVRNPFDGLPARGFDTYPGTARFLEAARRFAASHHVPTLSFAVQRDGRVVANHTLGFLDKSQERRAPRDSYFRIASLNKAVTASCVRRLIETGFVDPLTGTSLTVDAHFWPFLEGRGITPPPGVAVDPRTANITIGHLLAHASGTGYPPFAEQLYESLGADARAWEMAQAVYAAPLFFDPGSSTKYSNEGYFLLNYLVRLFTGDTEAFIESEVVDATAVGIDPLILSTEQLQSRDPHEVWYKTRDWPFDRWLYLDDFGHLSVTAQGYLRFLTRRIADGNPIPTTGDWWYFYGGEFTGTTTNAYQEIHNGRVTAFVILTNQHDYLLAPLWDEFVQILGELGDFKAVRPR